MTMNTGSMPDLLWPGMKKVWLDNEQKLKEEWPSLYTKESSTQNWEEYLEAVSTGLAPKIEEGAAVSYEDMAQGFKQTFRHGIYGLGIIITEVAIEDNQYSKKILNGTRALMYSMSQTKENVAAIPWNHAYDTAAAYAYGDGQPLCSLLHPNKGAGGTWRNTLTVASDLNLAALQQMSIDIKTEFKTNKGLRISVKPRKLICSVEDQFTAAQLLLNPMEPGTANNDINVLNRQGYFPEGYMPWTYASDPDAFFILTDFPESFVLLQRRERRFDRDQDFDTANLKAKATERYAFGILSPKSLFASPGA